MTKLDEGLRRHDLIDLVLPTITIDEYESKIDDDAIVVGFYVDDDLPAKDLSSFIETGSGSIIDTEVSPASNEQGNYLVFVEFMRDEKFPENLAYVLETVEALTGINEWKFTYYKGKEDEAMFSREAIMKKIRLEKKNPEETEEQLESIQFFKTSILDDVRITGRSILLRRRTQTKLFEKIAFDEEEILIELLSLNSKPFSMDTKSLRECNAIRNMLGHNWDVNKIDNHYILANDKDTKIMVVK